jgi:DNA-binding NtrC family response regulator
MKARILVIDDETAIRDSMKMILEYEGYEFAGAASGNTQTCAEPGAVLPICRIQLRFAAR